MTSKIILITQFFPPETGAAARRIHALACALSRHHDIMVVTLKPGYPSPQLFNEIDIKRFDEDLEFTIKRAFRFQPYSKTLLLRGIREMLMSLRLMLAASFSKADVLFVTTPSMFIAPFAWVFARLKRARFACDVRDLTWRYSGESMSVGVLGKIISSILEYIMRATLKRADLVVGATPGVSSLLASEHDVPREKLVTIENGVSENFVLAFDAQRGDISDRQPQRILYAGLLGYNQKISSLIEVARLLPIVDFVIAGDGPERSLIESQLDPGTLPNVDLKPYTVQKDAIIQYYSGADILFAQIKDTPTLNSTSIGSKIFEYMATGKPIVYAGKGLAVDFLAPIGCAEIADPENPDSIAAAIRRLLDNPERARAMGKKGRDFVVDKYVREDLMESYVAEINDRLLLL